MNELSRLAGERKDIQFEWHEDEFSNEENILIQEFIDWDNPGKNEMFLAVLNYALEYLLVAGDNDLQNRSNIKNAFAEKKLYIDTNVIFYCLGINGTVHEEANRTFLKKCRECQEQIYISYYANLELMRTLDHFISELERLNSPAIHNTRICVRMQNKDVYSYYILWSRQRKKLTEPKYFKQYLLDKYNKLIDEFEIVVERKIPIPEADLAENDTFQAYNEEIICQSDQNYDARNVFLIESLRKPDEKNLQSTRVIFISADKYLQKWDADRAKELPVVVAPNLWLILLARLISRSDDDYKCFISYINLTSAEPIISNKEYFTIVKVISDLVSDVSQQESVIDVMINEEFSFLNNEGEKRSNEFIVEKTINETERIRTKEIEELKAETAEAMKRLNKVEETVKNQKMALQDAERLNEEKSANAYKAYYDLKSEKDAIEEKSNELEKRLQESEEKHRKVRCYAIIAIITAAALAEMINIFIMKNPNPVTYRIFSALLSDSVCEPENMKEQYLQFIPYLLSGIAVIVDAIVIKFLKEPQKSKWNFWHK